MFSLQNDSAKSKYRRRELKKVSRQRPTLAIVLGSGFHCGLMEFRVWKNENRPAFRLARRIHFAV
jgi:hypothetical protein